MLTEHFHNTQKDTGHYSNDLRYVLSLQNTIAAFEEIKTWEGYAKTPCILLILWLLTLGSKIFTTKMKALALGWVASRLWAAPMEC